MNNYWHTNYKADQEGPATLRYAVTPHRSPDPAAAKRLGLEATTPLLAVAADPASPPPRFPLAVLSDAFVATRLKPAADGKGWIVRFFNASSRTEKLFFKGEAIEGGRVFMSDIWESEGGRLSAPAEVPPFGILTLLVR
jgi:alpha-mannosidase